jgi:hypothetical protein
MDMLVRHTGLGSEWSATQKLSRLQHSELTSRHRGSDLQKACMDYCRMTGRSEIVRIRIPKTHPGFVLPFAKERSLRYPRWRVYGFPLRPIVNCQQSLE